jgi:hypothetical protein
MILETSIVIEITITLIYWALLWPKSLNQPPTQLDIAAQVMPHSLPIVILNLDLIFL